jgi:O-methyltransferase
MLDSIYATRPADITVADCDFYHVMDLPRDGTVGGQWDLRETVDSYLGLYRFSGKRVLEVGPASGFLTSAMELRGADVVCLEVTDEHGWDFVPFPRSVLDPHMASRAKHMRRIKNSWWYVHQEKSMKAHIHYGDVYNIPDSLGEFDAAVLAAVMTHCQNPVQMMAECAKRAKAIIISETYRPDLEGKPVCLLSPSTENKDWGTWWQFSTDFFKQYLGVLGYNIRPLIKHEPKYHGTPVQQFTIVGVRS